MEEKNGTGEMETGKKGKPKRIPFQNYVNQVKQGNPELAEGSFARRVVKNQARPRNLTATLILLAMVVAAGLYLQDLATSTSKSSSSPELLTLRQESYIPSDPRKPSSMGPAMADALGFVPSEDYTPPTRAKTKVQTEAPKPRKPVLSGTFYTDPSEARVATAKPGDGLQYGDYVTVIPKVWGWNYLYFIVFEPSARFRISRIYPKEVIRTSAPPLKFRVRSKSTGYFQVVLLGSKEEIKEISIVVAEVNALQAKKGSARNVRFKAFLEGLGKYLPEGSWDYSALEAIRYSPEGAPSTGI